MKNVFGDSSSSDSEDIPVTKVRRIADLGAKPVLKKRQYEEDSDLDAQLDKLTNSISDDSLDESRPIRDVKNVVDIVAPKASVTKSIMNTDSIAFQMMQKMGYKMGQSLGSEENSNAIHEPIISKQIKGRAGIGAKSVRPVSLPGSDETVSDETISSYRSFESRKHRELLNKKTISKVKDFCFRVSGDEESMTRGDLDLGSVNTLWRDHAFEVQQKIMPILKQDNLPSQNSKDVPAPKASGESSGESLDTAKELDILIHYCRLEFSYCPYCEVQYHDENDMEDHCPGKSPELHY